MSAAPPRTPMPVRPAKRPEVPPDALIEEARQWQRRRARRRMAAFFALGCLVILGLGAYGMAHSGSSVPAATPGGTAVIAHGPTVIYEKIETVIAIPHRPTTRRTGEIWFSTSAPSTYRELLTVPGASALEVGQGPGRYPKFGTAKLVYLYDAKSNTIYVTGALATLPAPPPSFRSAFRNLLAQPGVRTAGTRRFEGHEVYVIHMYAPSSATVNAANQIVVRTTTTVATMYIDTTTYLPLLAVSSGPDSESTVRVLAYRVLPATPATLRLISLASTHPGARVRMAPQSIKKLYDKAAQIGQGINGIAVAPGLR